MVSKGSLPVFQSDGDGHCICITTVSVTEYQLLLWGFSYTLYSVEEIGEGFYGLLEKGFCSSFFLSAKGPPY